MSEGPPYFLGRDAKLTDLLSAPRGTVHPHATKPGWWWVRGSAPAGEKNAIYEVFPGDPAAGVPSQCRCTGHNCRGDCFHAQVCREAQRRRDACPICGGDSFILASGVNYVKNGEPDNDPLPRLCCLGAGTRKAWADLGSFPPEAEPLPPGAGERGRSGLPPEWEAMAEDERKAVFA